MVCIGNEVVLHDPFWHHGDNLGDHIGRVISTESYVLVEIYDYNDNPVKCFQNDFSILEPNNPTENIDMDELYN